MSLRGSNKLIQHNPGEREIERFRGRPGQQPRESKTNFPCILPPPQHAGSPTSGNKLQQHDDN